MGRTPRKVRGGERRDRGADWDPAFLGARAFAGLAGEYRRAYGYALVCVDRGGEIVYGRPVCGGCGVGAPCVAARWRAVGEALRWGDPSVNLCPSEHLIWGVPLMCNGRVLGGLVATGAPLRAGGGAGMRRESARIRAACVGLRELAEREELTNGALLRSRRLDSERERERAVALHSLKGNHYDSIRSIYLREEPALLATIKRGERPAAREILNRILVGIYHVGGGRLELIRSFLLELVVMMTRAAVEAGGDPSELLGANYGDLTRLSGIGDEEGLCRWLTGMLERAMDAIRDNRAFPNTVLLENAVREMEARCGEELRRDDVARAACLSPGHFSRLLKERTGRTFTELLGELRVNRARELLRRSSMELWEIALECGFCDQSYFTRAFRRATGTTPRAYRLARIARGSAVKRGASSGSLTADDVDDADGEGRR